MRGPFQLNRPRQANPLPTQFSIWVILNKEDILTPLKAPALILRTALLAALLFLIAPGLYPQTPSAPPDDVAAQALKFTALYGAIEQHYVEPVDPDHAIFDGGIRGMLSALDPFCAFLDRDQFELDEAAGARGIDRIWLDPLRLGGESADLADDAGFTLVSRRSGARR